MADLHYGRNSNYNTLFSAVAPSDAKYVVNMRSPPRPQGEDGSTQSAMTSLMTAALANAMGINLTNVQGSGQNAMMVRRDCTYV